MGLENAILFNTRPPDVAQKFQDELACLLPQLRVISTPLMETEDIPQAHLLHEDHSRFAALLVTSARSLAWIKARQKHLPNRALVVGNKTADALRRLNIEILAVEESARALLPKIIALQTYAPFLYLRGEHVAFDLHAHLGPLEIDIDQICIYRQKLLPLSPAAQEFSTRENPIILPLLSPRAAQHFARIWSGIAPVHVVAMSEPIAKVLGNMTYRSITIAKRADLKAMLTAINEILETAG